MLRTLFAASLILMLANFGVAQNKEHGLKVGDKAPDFTLKDQNGKEQKLTDLLKESSVAIVFHRSASW